METPFGKRLEARARQSRFFALLLFGLGFLWEALAHEFFKLFDERVIRAIQSSLPLAVTAVQWTSGHPVWFIVGLGSCYCVILVFWALFWHTRAPVEIVSVWENDPVEYRQTLSGVVRHPSMSIQVLVGTASGKWHRQWQPEVDGQRWRAQCQFGNLGSRPGDLFRVVAILGADKVEQPISELPDKCKKSEIVTVRRSATAPAEVAPGIYLGRTRRSLRDGWVPYTTKVES